MVKLFSGIAHSSCILDSIYHKLVRYSYNVSVTRTQTEVLEVFFLQSIQLYFVWTESSMYI